MVAAGEAEGTDNEEANTWNSGATGGGEWRCSARSQQRCRAISRKFCCACEFAQRFVRGYWFDDRLRQWGGFTKLRARNAGCCEFLPSGSRGGTGCGTYAQICFWQSRRLPLAAGSRRGIFSLSLEPDQRQHGWIEYHRDLFYE